MNLADNPGTGVPTLPSRPAPKPTAPKPKSRVEYAGPWALLITGTLTVAVAAALMWLWLGAR
jgi:hypothetical protein